MLTALHRYRKLLGAAAVIWFTTLMVGGIFLSQLDARNGLHVFGPKHFVAGEPAVLRVGLRELAFNRFERIASVEATFIQGESRGRAQPMSQRAGDFVQGAVVPPGAGNFQLELATIHEDLRLIAMIDVHVRDRASSARLPPLPKDKTPPKPDTGDLKLDIASLSHVLPGNLPSRLVLRATDVEGRPVRSGVAIQMREGASAIQVPDSVVTDHNGLASLKFQAMQPRFWFDLKAGESEAARRIDVTPTQLVLELESPFARPGEEIPFGLRSMHRKGEVFVDLWHGERWIASTRVALDKGQASGRLRLPPLPADPAVLWLQAYRAAYLPQDARGGQHLLVSAGEPATSARWLAARLRDMGHAPKSMAHFATHADGDPLLAADLLSRTQRPERNPPLLADSSHTARQTVAGLKEAWQRRFVSALILSGILLFFVLAWLVRANHRQVTRDWALAGGADEGELGTRKRLMLESLYIFGVLALFLGGMIQLLLTIRW